MKNVLLVTIDSLRTDHVRYHGYERDVTPNIDKYAENGSRFMNAFAHAGGTKVSFPSILSSVDSLMYGGYRSGVSEEQTLVSEVFRDGGYQTAGFHSNLYVSSEFNYDRGFDVFYDSKENPSTTQKARRYVTANMKDSFIYPILQRVYDFVESSSGVNIGSFHTPGDELTDMALEYAKNTDDDSPKFMWVHYMDVHHPFLPPEEYQLEVRDSIISDREAIKLRRKFIEEPDEVTDEELSDFLDLYDAEILFTDKQVDRLIRGVREEWGDTLVALTADHGEHFVKRGSLSGFQFYDEKMCVPLFINGWDDQDSYDEIVGLKDLSPTLINYAGLEIPETYQGESLLPLVEDGEWSREEILGGVGEGNRKFVYRDDRWKYILRRGQGEEELYDLEEDPGEEKNMVEEHPETADRIREKIKRYEKEVEEKQTEEKDVEVGEEVKERLRKLGYDE